MHWWRQFSFNSERNKFKLLYSLSGIKNFETSSQFWHRVQQLSFRCNFSLTLFMPPVVKTYVYSHQRRNRQPPPACRTRAVLWSEPHNPLHSKTSSLPQRVQQSSDPFNYRVNKTDTWPKPIAQSSSNIAVRPVSPDLHSPSTPHCVESLGSTFNLRSKTLRVLSLTVYRTRVLCYADTFYMQ